MTQRTLQKQRHLLQLLNIIAGEKVDKYSFKWISQSLVFGTAAAGLPEEHTCATISAFFKEAKSLYL